MQKEVVDNRKRYEIISDNIDKCLQMHNMKRRDLADRLNSSQSNLSKKMTNIKTDMGKCVQIKV